jgi:hypothetical protein
VPPYPVDETPYPEDGTFEEQFAWIQANGQLPPYPKQHGTRDQKNAWARLSTKYLTAKAEEAEGKPATRWLAKDEWEPEAKDGWDDGLWLMPLDPGDLVAVVRRPARARTSRTPRRAQGASAPRRSRPGTPTRGSPDSSGSDDDPPLADLARTAAASARMVARIARRERRRFQRAGEVAA